MTGNDRMIDEALAAEERDLLRRIGEEPAYVEQALGLFAGRNGWVNGVLMLLQAVLFFGGLWAAWNFFTAETVLVALQWGLPAAVALLMAVTIKMALLPVLHIQRLRLELKRLELLLAAR
jgi:uncharacterized integral membrane protein